LPNAFENRDEIQNIDPTVMVDITSQRSRADHEIHRRPGSLDLLSLIGLGILGKSLGRIQ
jgi:hypothetical protein